MRLLSSSQAQVAALAVVLVLFGYNVIQYFSFVIETPWQLDFSDFYFAARTGLAHGWAQMYNTAVSMPALYAATGNWFPFQHSPVLAWLLVPLSQLPYALALSIWNGFLFGCYVVCWRLCAPGSRERRLLLLVAGLGLYPVVLGLALGRLAARGGPELPIAAGLSGSVLASPYLSVTDLSALLIAAWLVLRLDPPGWLKALMVVGYVPFFFANALFMHGPFLLLECAWLLALLVFAIKRRRGSDLEGWLRSPDSNREPSR